MFTKRARPRVGEVDDKGCLIVLARRWIAAKNPDNFPDGGELSVMIGKQVKCFLFRVPSRLLCLQLLPQFFRDQCLIYSSLAQCEFTGHLVSGVFSVLFASQRLVEFSDFGVVPVLSRADESHGFIRTCAFSSLRRSTSILVVPSGGGAHPFLSKPAARHRSHSSGEMPRKLRPARSTP